MGRRWRKPSHYPIPLPTSPSLSTVSPSFPILPLQYRLNSPTFHVLKIFPFSIFSSFFSSISLSLFFFFYAAHRKFDLKRKRNSIFNFSNSQQRTTLFVLCKLIFVQLPDNLTEIHCSDGQRWSILCIKEIHVTKSWLLRFLLFIALS